MGFCLHGRGWQTALSRDYNIKDRTIRHWVSGRNHIPERIFNDLIRRCGHKLAEDVCQVILGMNISADEEIAIGIYQCDLDLMMITQETWTCDLHLKIVRYMRVYLRNIVKVKFVTINGHLYFKWLDGRKNTPVMRSVYAATQCYKKNIN